MSPAPYLRLNPQDQVAIACRDLERYGRARDR
jgi:hypothetical protein